MDRRTLGTTGEQLAARYLEQKGYRVLVSNWRSHGVEIDLIARSGEGEVVFVEVKTRRSIAAGHPEDAVTSTKRGHLLRGAHVWLGAYRHEGPWRIDVIAITFSDGEPEIVHFEGI